MEPIAVIIVAGGSGSRCGGSLPKQFRLLGGEPILARTINTFAKALPGAQLIVVLAKEQIPFWKNLSARFDVAKHTLTEGGEERFYSVHQGLASLTEEIALIAVQDGVRPLTSIELIHRLVEAASSHGAAIPVIPPADSFRLLEPNGSHPIDRTQLRIVQTPQVFRSELLRDAYRTTYSPTFTDDASVVEASGHTVFLAEGEASNLKITSPDDLTIAEALLSRRQELEEERLNADK